MSWNPDQYDRFAQPRLQPAIDLLSAVAEISRESPESVVDLGCGSGAAFAILRERFPDAHLLGVERDAAMLEAARQTDIPIDLINCDINSWRPETAIDVVFSNAVLHWLPDHRELLPRLMGFLKPGGVLAVQIPNMWQEPVHVLMREVASNARWRDRAMAACRNAPVLSPQEYENILEPISETLRVWEQTYPHNLEGDDAVFEWISGSSLKPVLDALDSLGAGQRDEFSEQYKAALGKAYPANSDGTTPYPMKRLFIVAKVPTPRAPTTPPISTTANGQAD